MNFFRESFIVFVFHSLIFCTSSVFAINKIYVLGDGLTYGLGGALEYAIVADSDDWECSVSNKKIITGYAKYFPMSFQFEVVALDKFKTHLEKLSSQTVMKFAKDYLHSYAKITRSILSSISLCEQTAAYYVIDGVYFDNSHSGGFALYIQPITNTNSCYVMVVHLKEDLKVQDFNQQIRSILYHEVFDLILPLYSFG